MARFPIIDSVAAPLPQAGIDTDIIFPARFLLITEKKGLGRCAFYEWRYTAEGSERPEFVLNQATYRHAQILVCGDNFGAGSSREQAVWAIRDLGVRCVISTSFAEIFYGNCFNNGVLPVTVSPELLARLQRDAEAARPIRVDLAAMTITRDGEIHPFSLEDWRRQALLEGWDEIDVIVHRSGEQLSQFEARRRAAAPWLTTGGLSG